MRLRPFLSHSRDDADDVTGLKRLLCIYGTGGWRDLDDLRLGSASRESFEEAIRASTAGFIWYGTPSALSSSFINEVELPTAIARRREDPTFPLVPLFVELKPSDTAATLRDALGTSGRDLFLDANGVVRGGRPYDEFHRHVARRYVEASLAAVDQETFSVACTAFTAPSGDHDLTFDWRALLDPDRRVLEDGCRDVLVDALRTVRDSVKSRTEFPRMVIDAHLPLPLATLIGYEWRTTTGLQITVRQRSQAVILDVAAGGDAADPQSEWVNSGAGADAGDVVVVAVSTAEHPPGASADRYARTVGARETLELHAPGPHDAPSLRGIARRTASKLRELALAGADKHLLITGPLALGVLLGAYSNANGAITMPFWNGTEYVSPLRITA